MWYWKPWSAFLFFSSISEFNTIFSSFRFWSRSHLHPCRPSQNAITNLIIFSLHRGTKKEVFAPEHNMRSPVRTPQMGIYGPIAWPRHPFLFLAGSRILEATTLTGTTHFLFSSAPGHQVEIPTLAPSYDNRTILWSALSHYNVDRSLVTT